MKPKIVARLLEHPRPVDAPQKARAVRIFVVGVVVVDEPLVVMVQLDASRILMQVELPVRAERKAFGLPSDDGRRNPVAAGFAPDKLGDRKAVIES